jgi:hypothetical protein
MLADIGIRTETRLTAIERKPNGTITFATLQTLRKCER